MKSQQRRGPDGDGDFQYALRRHEHCAQAQQDTVQGAQLRCLLSRSIQDQQLMLQKKRFGNDRAGTAGSHGSDSSSKLTSDSGLPELLSKLQFLSLIIRSDFEPVERLGTLRHPLVAQPADPLAVL